MKNIQRTLILGTSIVALAGCGADEIVSPGTSGDVNVNITDNSVTNPAPPPTTDDDNLVEAAASCPGIRSSVQLLDTGVISGPTGSYRICQLPEVFDEDDNLPQIDGLAYRIFGQVSVGEDLGPVAMAGENSVELSIEPGVLLVAAERAFLVVQRGNTILADGTPTSPIIWTATDNIREETDGAPLDDADGLWGGVVLLGRAQVSDCATGGVNIEGQPVTNPNCQQELEGTDVTTLFGGQDDTDSSGSFTFNQIRFSGFELAPDNELQSLTTGGVGSGTTIANVQSFNSSDDGVEFFGGNFNASNFAVIGASDDSLDVDTGARVNMQTVIVAQRDTTGDHMIELDSDTNASRPLNAAPRTNLQLNNFTFLQGDGRDTAVRARGSVGLSLNNGVMSITRTTTTCFRLDEQGNVDRFTIDSVVANCGTDAFGGLATETEAVVNAGTNNDIAFMLTLVGAVNGANENAATAFDATVRSSFFADNGFVGAVTANIADDFGGWTCNSATLDFGSSNGDCTSLPGA